MEMETLLYLASWNIMKKLPTADKTDDGLKKKNRKVMSNISAEVEDS